MFVEMALTVSDSHDVSRELHLYGGPERKKTSKILLTRNTSRLCPVSTFVWQVKTAQIVLQGGVFFSRPEISFPRGSRFPAGLFKAS
jgi:hypothetical protein